MEVEVMSLDELKKVMDENNIETLDEIDNTAFLVSSNFGGMVILIDKSADGVFIQEVWDSGHKDIVEAEIYYDEWDFSDEDELFPCFDYEGEQYFLADFMRKNYGG